MESPIDSKLAMYQFSSDEVRSWRDVLEIYKHLNRFFLAVKPFHAFSSSERREIKKVRIGGRGNGGYVMLEPGIGGTAYSFGVSNWAPWDLEMASLGFQVFQYDGSVAQSPDPHPNIYFNQYHINGFPTPKEGAKNIGEIFADLGHCDNDDIILQIDIEGEEWPFFQYISEEHIMKFKQIIVEFHGHILTGPYCEKYLSILEKINKTHCCVHVHGVNCFGSLGFFPGNCIYTFGFEMTYARRTDYVFKESLEFYPTPLDGRCVWEYPDIILGSFAGI